MIRFAPSEISQKVQRLRPTYLVVVVQSPVDQIINVHLYVYQD